MSLVFLRDGTNSAPPLGGSQWLCCHMLGLLHFLMEGVMISRYVINLTCISLTTDETQCSVLCLFFPLDEMPIHVICPLFCWVVYVFLIEL